MTDRLLEIFKGLETAYGITKATPEIRADGKNEVKSFTIKKPVTKELWDKHLQGIEPGLGVVPINEKNECKWGCIDIDLYNGFNHKRLIKKIRKKGLPLIVFRSKSGGAHVFLFIEKFIPASVIRQKLQMMSSALGYAKAEIFPKQANIKADRGDIGNFLNMPYHGGNRSVRYAFSDEGEALKIDEFIKLYDKYVQTEESVTDLLLIKEDNKEIFPDGPPCLNTIIEEGPIVEGNGEVAASGRDNGLFNIGVYLRKAFPTDWKNKLEDYNTSEYVNPPLKSDDIIRIKEQLSKKDYDFKCKDKPICNFCNEKLCYTKPFGKGNEVRMPVLTTIRKYKSDPPIFFVSVDDDTIEVDAPTLHDPEKFSVRCLEELGTPLLPIPKLIWRKNIALLMKNMEETEAPDDTRIDVQLKEVLQDFVNRNGKDWKSILSRKPYTIKGITYFKFKDFWLYLIRTRSWPEKSYPKNKTIRLIEDLFKGRVETVRIEDKQHKVWAVENMEIEKYTPQITKKEPAPFE